MTRRLCVTRVAAAVAVSGVLAAAMPAAPGRAAAAARAGGSAPGGALLQQALNKLVAMPSGPPGVIVIVQHGSRRAVYQAGTASLAHPRPLSTHDHQVLASFSKAFNGAVALSLVSRRRLRLTDTIGRWLPGLPRAWHRVTLGEMLQHRSGLPDYTSSQALARRLQRAPLWPPAPPAVAVRLAQAAGCSSGRAAAMSTTTPTTRPVAHGLRGGPGAAMAPCCAGSSTGRWPPPGRACRPDTGCPAPTCTGTRCSRGTRPRM